MATPHRPRAVAFDVVETLVSLDAVDLALDDAGVGPYGLERFFGRLLRTGFALAASQTYQPFGVVADTALADIAPGLGPGERKELLGAFARLDAHPDARPAVERVTDADLPVVALTNGSAENTKALLTRAGLDSLVSRVISIDEVRTWKPAAAPYLHAAAALEVEAPQLAMVAVHAWDVHGAHQAGLVTGWASRLEGTFPPTFETPDVTGVDLVDVVEGLLALPES